MDEGKTNLVYKYFRVAYEEDEADDLVEFIEKTPDELERIYKNIQTFFLALAEENGYISPDNIDEVCSDRARDYSEGREEAYS